LPEGLLNVLATPSTDMGRPDARVCTAVSFTDLPFLILAVVDLTPHGSDLGPWKVS
jgi:hypothetical protein